MRNKKWIWHHVPYVLIGTVALYLITEPGSHNSASFFLYLLFIPMPLMCFISRLRSGPAKEKLSKEKRDTNE